MRTAVIFSSSGRLRYGRYFLLKIVDPGGDIMVSFHVGEELQGERDFLVSRFAEIKVASLETGKPQIY